MAHPVDRLGTFGLGCRLERKGRLHQKMETAILADEDREVLESAPCRTGTGTGHIEDTVRVLEESVHSMLLSERGE